MSLEGLSTRIPTVSPERVVDAAGALVIDLRSPAEFADDHVPGAVNVPLFDDFERAVVGTLYARRSPQAAFEEGRRTTRRKVDDLVARIGEYAGWHAPAVDLGHRVEELTAAGIGALEDGLEPEPTAELPPDMVVLACWRGGLRSRSVTALLRGLGLERAVMLEGGYRAYRRHVRAGIDAWLPPRCFVLRGLTGVGKSLVLRAIEELRPGWTLDLELLAEHRSSILGMVGLEPVTQKRFESRLAQRLRAGFEGPCVLEGESRKVGDVILPPAVWNALIGGTSLELVASVERRVRVLIEDYLVDEGNRDELARQLPFLEERLGKEKWKGKLVELLVGGREEELVALLLERYYDPLYRHSESKHVLVERFSSESAEDAAASVVEWIERRLRHEIG